MQHKTEQKDDTFTLKRKIFGYNKNLERVRQVQDATVSENAKL